MTLDEMLALLPDNDTGEITAGDLRDIVTDLWTSANTIYQTYAFNWTTDTSPGAGKICLNAGWSASSTLVHISEITSDGMNTPFAFADEGNQVSFMLGGQDRLAKITGRVVATSVDQGNYRDVAVAIDSVKGTPANNQLLTLALAILPS